MAKQKREKANKSNEQEIEKLETESAIIEDIVDDEEIQEKIFEIIKFDLNEIINNETIKEIQLALKEIGYNTNTLGDYNKTTYGAICDYKRKNKYKEVNGDITERLYKELVIDKVRS